MDGLMPPTKLKPSGRNYDRMSGKTTIVHYWIKGISQKELFEELNKDNTRPVSYTHLTLPTKA